MRMSKINQSGKRGRVESEEDATRNQRPLEVDERRKDFRYQIQEAERALAKITVETKVAVHYTTSTGLNSVM